MKRIILILTSAVLALSLMSGCADGRKAVDMSALRTAMLEAADLPDMLTASSSDSDAARSLASLTDIDYGLVAEYFIDCASDGSAYEIAVIRLKNDADVSAVVQDLRAHTEHRAEQYRYYKPDQTANAENAIVTSQGCCAALIMCDDPPAVRSAFDKAFD